MSEIVLEYDELSKALNELMLLEKGTGYKIYFTSDFINHSRGKMFENTNAFYSKLMQIEDVMIEIVSRTKIALNNAGIQFETAENESITSFSKIHETLG